MPTELYTPTEVREVRKKLLKEQGGKDLMTDLEIPATQAVLDHDHDTQLVRGVLHRQANASLGKIENLYIRYLKWWYPYDLPTFLRQCADYIERKPDDRYYHPGWLKKVNSSFNKLNAAEKTEVLKAMNLETGTNDTQRKANFKSGVLTRKFSFGRIIELIKQAGG